MPQMAVRHRKHTRRRPWEALNIIVVVCWCSTAAAQGDFLSPIGSSAAAAQGDFLSPRSSSAAAAQGDLLSSKGACSMGPFLPFQV